MKTSEIIMIISGVVALVSSISNLFFVGTPTFWILFIIFLISIIVFFASLGAAEYETFFKE